MSNSKKEVTLLLVEDDDIDAMTIERSFQKKRIGNSIIRTYDGYEALKMLQDGKIPAPFVILLDLQMPRMNGLEFLQHIRADHNLSSSVIFVLTTSKAEEDMVASYRQQVAGYFVKDEAGEHFINMVDILDSYWKIVHLPK
ncbi:MAG: response regulator [Sneathiella sp.]|nr:response regulator [Sneathiella sp.]